MCGALVLAACQPAAPPAPPASPSSPAAREPTAAPEPAAPTSAPAAEKSKPAAPAASLRFRYPVFTGAWIPFMLARQTGIFDRYSLQVDLQQLASQQMIQAVVTGQVDIAGTSAEAIVNAAVGGAPLVFVGGMYPRASGFLMAHSSIQRVQDLKGATLVVTQFGNVSHFGLMRILRLHGLDPEKDVTVTQVQDIQAQVAAVQAGQAKAFVAFPPDDIFAKRIGMHELFNVDELRIPYVQASVFLSRAYLQQNRDVVSRFMQALVEGIYAMKTRPDLALETFLKNTRMQDQETARRAVEFSSQLIERVPAISTEGLKNVIEVVAGQNPRASSADPNSLWDRSALDEVARSGLVERLYR